MAVGNGYSSAQILAMQKDAIRRVNEMQRLSQERLRRTQETMGEPSVSQPLSGRTAPPSGKASPQGHPGGRPAAKGQSGNAVNPPQRMPSEGQRKAPQEHTHGIPESSESPKHLPPSEEQTPLPQWEESELPMEKVLESPENPFKGILERIGLDKETSLVLLLLVLLVNEGADSKLIMALVYILL